MFLKNIKLADLEKGRKYSFLMPIGSTEQHGPFLPFGTDTYLTDGIVKGIEKKLPHLIVAPTLEYSCSQEHEGFGGTMWLRPETLVQVLHDLCESLLPYAHNIIFLTAHGGNEDAFDIFFKQYSEAFPGVKMHKVSIDSDELENKTKELIGGPVDMHAGNTEISMMLSMAPQLVTLPTQEYKKTVVTNPWETGRLADRSNDGIADAHPQWVIDEKIGEKIFAMIIEKALQDISRIIG